MKLPCDRRGLEGGALCTDDWWQYALPNTRPRGALPEQAGRKGCSKGKGKHESQAWQAPSGLLGSKNHRWAPVPRLSLSVWLLGNAASAKQLLQAKMETPCKASAFYIFFYVRRNELLVSIDITMSLVRIKKPFLV